MESAPDSHTFFYNYLKKFGSFTEAQWDAMKEPFYEKRYAPEECVVEKGAVYNKWFFVVSGVLRFHRLVEGKDVTFNLFAKNRIFTDLESLNMAKPSEHQLSSVTNSVLLVCDIIDWEETFNKHPEIGFLFRKNVEFFFAHWSEDLQSILFDSPLERYRKIKKQLREQDREIPEKYIASYLNITPQSLSRIKRDIAHG